MKPSTSASTSVFLDIRGLKYHVRTWGSVKAPKLFLLHGWMDVSASFQFLVDALQQEWHVIAPDWRGFGLTEWTRADCYWYPDYFADLDCLLDHFQPDEPVNIAGHSMGGNVLCIYSGVRPQRIGRLINMEGLSIRDNPSDEAPGRYAKWLDQLKHGSFGTREYGSFEDLAARLSAGNCRLSEERAQFLARHWGKANDDGRIVLRSDPRHKIVNPTLYHAEEAIACVRRISAPILWVTGEDSDIPKRSRVPLEEMVRRKSFVARLTEACIEDAGHMLHHDQPERLAQIIEKFLQPAAQSADSRHGSTLE